MDHTESDKLIKGLVSVGIPVFNGGKSLERAIQSILDQDYTNLELIVSDNASIDNTQEICNKFAQQDQRIRTFKQKNNIGPTKNFQYVLSKAIGEYFMWLAHDDWIDPNYLGVCVRNLYTFDGLVLSAGRSEYIYPNGETNQLPSHSYSEISPVKRVIHYFKTVSHNSIFYGVFYTDIIKHSIFINAYGNDWITVASVLTKGKSLTNEEAAIHRSARGTSADIKSLFLNFGLIPRSWMYAAIGLVITATACVSSKQFWQTRRPLFVRIRCAVSVGFLIFTRIFIIKLIRIIIVRGLHVRNVQQKIQNLTSRGNRRLPSWYI
jgi:glycosyltransferase involved in cell wall biosynthesis